MTEHAGHADHTADTEHAVNTGHVEHAGHADCSEVLHRIFEYLDGELTPADVARVAAHLQDCAPCLAEHDLERTLKAVVRRSCAGESAPPTLRMSIMQRITTIRIDRTP